MKCRLLTPLQAGPSHPQSGAMLPVGTILDHPDAYWLVLQGCAEPADEECSTKAPVTPQLQAQRLDAYLMTAAGITPEDREAWQRGFMRGYNPDGTWIRGPNADEYDQQEWEEYKRNSSLVLP